MGCLLVMRRLKLSFPYSITGNAAAIQGGGWRGGAWVGWMQALAWCGEWCAKSGLQAVCIFRLFRVSNLCEHQTIAVFDLKVRVGWGDLKV